MKFSIIVPVYNVALYLKECLDSIMAQTYRDFEVICVNDGSTDNSWEIMQSYIGKIPNLTNIKKENGGLSSARNKGLEVAQGEYILFIDSDDWIEKNTLEVLAKNLNGDDIICFNGRLYIEHSKEFKTPDILQREQGLTGWQYYSRYALQSRQFAFVCVVLRCYRRELFIKNNISFLNGIYHEDNLFTPQVCYAAKSVSVIPDVLYIYRIRENSTMTTRGIKHFKDMVTLTNSLTEFFIDKKNIDKTTLYRVLTQQYQVVLSIRRQEYKKILRPLVRWDLYKIVSRTKLRHRINFILLRISPKLFHMANKTK